MKYCNSCGNLIPNRAKECPICGFRVNKKQDVIYHEEGVPPIEEYSKKNVFINKVETVTTRVEQHNKNIESRILNNPTKKNLLHIFPFFLIPGVGHFYAGSFKKGLYLFISFLIILTLDITLKIANIWAVIPITSIGYTTLMIWGIVGSIKQVRAFNEELANYYQNIPQKRKIDYSINPAK
ncbi:MAG: hypothetical protein ACTSQF_10320 [Candidatus Heimdallarchaeaceae archaeon]